MEVTIVERNEDILMSQINAKSALTCKTWKQYLKYNTHIVKDDENKVKYYLASKMVFILIFEQTSENFRRRCIIYIYYTYTPFYK